MIAVEETKIPDPLQVKRTLCKKSFFHFVKTFWDTIIKEPPVWNWHIPFLCGEIETLAEYVIKRKPKPYDLVVNISPGTTKSTLFSVMLPAWIWTRDASIRTICGSYSYPLGLDLSLRTRDIILSARYQKLFPQINLRYDMATKIHFTNTVGGSRYTTSTGGSVTGMHGHLIIVDDPIDPLGAARLTEINTVNDWYDGTLSTRKINKANTPTILVMQRLGQEDLTGHFLKNARNIRHLRLPATSDYPISPPSLKKYYDMHGGLLDKQRLSKSVLEESRLVLGMSKYASQYGQEPLTGENAEFDCSQLQYKDRPPLDTEVVKTVRYWDKAGTAEGHGARTAGVKIAVTSKEEYYVLDVVVGRWIASDREATIKKTAQRDGYNVIVMVEQEPGSSGKESAMGTIKRLAGYVVKADRPTGDKVTRAQPWASQVNSGNVFLLRGAWNDDFVSEHTYFPNANVKDIVDACSGAFAELAGLNKKRKQVRSLL